MNGNRVQRSDKSCGYQYDHWIASDTGTNILSSEACRMLRSFTYCRRNSIFDPKFYSKPIFYLYELECSAQRSQKLSAQVHPLQDYKHSSPADKLKLLNRNDSLSQKINEQSSLYLYELEILLNTVNTTCSLGA